VSGLPALIRASLIFVIVCKVQLLVYFSYLPICAFNSENIFFKLLCYIILAMSRQNRVRKPIILDIKKEIISKRESGKSVGDLNAKYGMAKSTISTILKSKEEIKCTQVAKGMSRLSSSRCNITKQVETVL